MSFNYTKQTRPQQLKLDLCGISNSNSSIESDDEDAELTLNQNNIPRQGLYISHLELIGIIDHKDESIAIIDVRSNRFYQMQHIKYATNFNCSTKLMARRSKVKWSKFHSDKSFKSVIIYDEKELILDRDMFATKFINQIKLNNSNVLLLSGGFSEFSSKVDKKYLEKKMSSQRILEYAASPTHRECSSEDVMKTTMSEIIPKFLYLGNELDAKDKHVLKEKKITDIMNVTSHIPFFFENNFKYYRIPASDSDKQNLSQYFDEAFQIIEDVRQRNGRIFIHCWAGVSRSSTIVMMYIMRIKNMDVLETLKYVQERRPIADPNLNFLGQLAVLSNKSS